MEGMTSSNYCAGWFHIEHKSKRVEGSRGKAWPSPVEIIKAQM